jgi:hypothetical protein
VKTFDNGLATDTISEETSAAGVTIDGVLLKDSQVTTDQINEKTSAAGVTVDGVLLKDTGVGSAASPVTLNSLAYPTEGSVNFRNRIINGDMRIDQRNAGAAVTINAASQTYTLDRWRGFGQATDGVFTVQQSATAPTGFTNSLLVTETTADASICSTQVYVLSQSIEGLNVSDLAWGTANAQTVTISFWVRSSLTGTFSGSLKNSAGSRSYPFTFTISAANTYEQKSVTIPGDTTGTWLTTNGIGIGLTFNIGSGSNRLGTAGAWAAANLDGATGSTSLISTNGATFYITGVQLEVGSVATPFERRPFGTELALCQRYFYLFASGNNANLGVGGYYNSTYVTTTATFPVTMRAAPSLVQTTGTNYYRIFANNTSDDFNSFNEGIQQPTVNTAGLDCSSGVSGTAGHVGRIITNNASASIAFNSEL